MGATSIDMTVRIFAVIAVLSLTLHTVYGIKCYQCNSVRDKGCDELTSKGAENSYFKECEPMRGENRSTFFCRTITQTIKDRGNLLRVVRSCGWEKYHRECYDHEDQDHIERVCQCFTDGCNSRAAPGLKPTILASLAIFPIVLAVWRH